MLVLQAVEILHPAWPIRRAFRSTEAGMASPGRVLLTVPQLNAHQALTQLSHALRVGCIVLAL